MTSNTRLLTTLNPNDYPVIAKLWGEFDLYPRFYKEIGLPRCLADVPSPGVTLLAGLEIQTMVWGNKRVRNSLIQEDDRTLIFLGANWFKGPTSKLLAVQNMVNEELIRLDLPFIHWRHF